VMSLVYPSLKLIFEASTRRITVKLTWTEGPKSYSTELVQWMASPQRAGVVGDDPNAPDGGVAGSGAVGSGGAAKPGGAFGGLGKKP
jgi:general secretion pathway protein I